MSIPASRTSSDFKRLGWALRLAPALVSVVLALLWSVDRAASSDTLVLNAPTAVTEGTTVGLRAWLLSEAGSPHTPTSVEVLDPQGNRIANAELRASNALGMEGDIAIPPDAEGVLSFVARTEHDGRPIEVRYTAPVETEASLSTYRPERQSSPFHVYELGPLRVVDASAAPTELDPRIEEGACVPELACTLSVWVGARSARVRVDPEIGVRLLGSSTRAGHGFLRFPLMVRGNEARIAVVALDEHDRVVASREVRLPIVPGGIRAAAHVDAGNVRLDWETLGSTSRVLVDVYSANRWVHASSVTLDDPWLPLTLGRGVWRLQLRVDPFSDDAAGVVHVVIADGPSDALALAADAIVADAQRDGLDPLAIAVREGRVPASQHVAALAALFGPRNFGVVSFSGVASSLGEARDAPRRNRARWLAAAAILTIGGLVSWMLLRLEFASRRRALEVFEGFEEPVPESSGLAPAEGWLWAFVLSIFVAIAAVALSKGWF